MASLQSSVSPVPQLLNATRPESVLAFNNSSNKNLLSVDFVGLYCKRKRTRRRIGVSSSASSSSSFYRFVNNNKNKYACSVNATLSVDRVNDASSAASPPDFKPQACIFFFVFV